MLDEQEAPAAEAEDDAVDVAEAGGDDAVDLADLGGEVQTADEPAVSAEELLEIPDAPAIPGHQEHIEEVLGDAATGDPVPTESPGGEAAALGEQAAAEDAAGADAEPPDASGSEESAAVAEAEPPDASASEDDGSAAAEEDGADA